MLIQEFAAAWMLNDHGRELLLRFGGDRITIIESSQCTYTITYNDNRCLDGPGLLLLGILLNDDSFINGFRSNPELVTKLPFTFIIHLD